MKSPLIPLPKRLSSCRSTWLAALLAAAWISTAHAQFTNDYQTNTITSATNWGGVAYYVGSNSVSDVLLVNSGGMLTNVAPLRIGYTAAAGNNMAVVSGTGLLRSSDDIVVGENGSGNQVIITNGGQVRGKGELDIGNNPGATSNMVLVSGSGSIADMGGTSYGVFVGYAGAFNQLVISNGGVVVSPGRSDIGYAGSGNVVLVTGGGSIWTNGGSGKDFRIGGSGNNNMLIVTNGGRVVSDIGTLAHIGTGGSGQGNMALVSGSNSVWSTGHIFIGEGADNNNNQLLITDGGTVVARTQVVIGAGKSNTVQILGGGMLDCNQLVVGGAGFGNRIINSGGIFQFSTPAMVITTNGDSGGSIILTNGIISFRSIANAPLFGGSQLENITFQGDNGYQLGDNAANAAVTSYTFDSGVATNYQSLHLVGVNPFWQSTALTIGSGGALVVSNATGAKVSGTVTNAGSIQVFNAQAIYNGNVVNLGAYVSDPSTNAFNGNFTVGATGYVSAASNDIYAFGGNFILQSTNKVFNLSSAHVLFATNGYGLATTTAGHLLSVSNSGALNLGTGQTNFSQVASNFAFGTLSIEVGNRLTIAGNKDSSGTNALYVGWLDIQGANTNTATSTFDTTTNSLFLALNLPNVNLYYDKYDHRNDWLTEWVPSTGYELWGSGNGLLLPIPEPSSILAVGAGMALLLFLRRRG